MMGIYEFILALAGIIVLGILGLAYISARFGLLDKTDDKKNK